MELILYTSNSTGVASNCLYPNRAVITDPDGLVAAGKFDQVFARYKDNYRSIENFLESYVIPQDVDNESDDPNDWKTVEDLEEEFADVVITACLVLKELELDPAEALAKKIAKISARGGV